MYYCHFKLSGPPFQLTPATSRPYMSREHSEALALLEWGMAHEMAGYTMLVGEPGTGKTTLVSEILGRSYPDVRAVYLSHPKLSFEETLQLALRQVGVNLHRPTRIECLDAYRTFLSELNRGERVAIIADEASAISDELLADLCFLADYGSLGEGRTQIVLVGQPGLVRRLQSSSLLQLNERIGARAVLNPLAEDEVYEYIRHRLSQKGGNIYKIFARAAVRHLVRHSHGIPARVNILCHNALLAAYAAGAKRVSIGFARAAVAEYEQLGATDRQSEATGAKSRLPMTWRQAWPAAVLGASLITGMGGAELWLWTHMGATSPARQASAIAPIPPSSHVSAGRAAAGYYHRRSAHRVRSPHPAPLD
jgi:type II secretory pathway predicted ATPase ExeA